MRESLKWYLGKSDISVLEAIEKIDQNSRGILFIEDDEERLVGVITDGDVRRWIMKCGDISAPVKNVMNSSPIYLSVYEKEMANMTMNKANITAVPILNYMHKIVEICWKSDNAADALNEKTNKLNSVPVIVMAGGRGTRLYPFTRILPKPLIPVGDIPILERVLNSFFKYGVDEFYITVNYKKEMIKSYFTELSPNYKINYVEETIPLGTGGGLKLINHKFEKPLFVINCDALILADYSDIYEYHQASSNEITIVSALKKITVPYGVLKTAESDVVTGLEEKPSKSFLINTGMYVINPEIINEIPDNVSFHMTQLIQIALNKGYKVGMYPVSEESFLDMGEIEGMRHMEERLGVRPK